MVNRRLDLGPLTALAADVETNVNRFLDDVAAGAPEELRDILFESKQSTMGRAIVADVIDVIPLVGDFSNFFRVRHASREGITRQPRVGRQALDLALGSLPEPVGAVLDILTPTNTITYLREQRLLR